MFLDLAMFRPMSMTFCTASQFYNSFLDKFSSFRTTGRCEDDSLSEEEQVLSEQQEILSDSMLSDSVSETADLDATLR